MNWNNLNNILAQQPAYRLKQVYQLVYKNLLIDWTQASSLPKDLRQRLLAEVDLNIKAQISKSAKNTTSKALLFLNDGLSIETVLLQHEDGRNTVCVSCQVGCPLGCTFCATGELGFKRNLTKEEIVEQVLLWQRELINNDERVTNIVFMGMGEPGLNLDNVLASIEILNDKNYFNIGARHISISTAGLIEAINRLADWPHQINLAISLHAPNDQLRKELMPIANKYKIINIIKAVDRYILATNRQVMFEYLLIKDINDSSANAEQLAGLMNKPLYVVNLIPYNQTGKYKTVNTKIINSFKQVLTAKGIKVTQRYSFGGDIIGACGQLAAKNNK